MIIRYKRAYIYKLFVRIFVMYATPAKLPSTVALSQSKVGDTVTQLTLVTLLQRRYLSVYSRLHTKRNRFDFITMTDNTHFSAFPNKILLYRETAG